MIRDPGGPLPLNPFKESAAAFLAAAEAILAGPRPGWTSLASLVLSTLLAWFVYVPVHELLHACGCLLAGGKVAELQIAPLYGGRLLERVIPFVRAGGEYAGRLSGFDTRGSDLTYLATDFAPYLLTIFFAIPCLELARRRRSALLFGPGAVLVTAPLMSLVGDYFEMAGILVSRAIAAIRPGTDTGALRSDDLILLLSELPARFPQHRAAWGAVVGVTFLVGCALASATLTAAVGAGRFAGRGTAPRSRDGSRAPGRSGPGA